MHLIPNKKQWNSWSLPSKLTAIGTLIGVLMLALYIAEKAFDIIDAADRWVSKKSSSETSNIFTTDQPQPPPKPTEPADMAKVTTLYDMFRADCSKTHMFGKRYLAHETGPYEIEYIVCCDFETKTTYLSLFLPKSDLTFAACKFLSKGYKEILDQELKILMHGMVYQPPGERDERYDELKFSGRIYIYHETYLLPERIDVLVKEYGKKGLSPQFRGRDYEIIRNSPLYNKS